MDPNRARLWSQRRIIWPYFGRRGWCPPAGFLETQADVGDYLNRLRQALEAAINSNERVGFAENVIHCSVRNTFSDR